MSGLSHARTVACHLRTTTILTSLSMSRKAKVPVLGVGDALGAGDSYLVADLLPTDQADHVFETLKSEVGWKTMLHRGGEVPRLVAVQGEIDADGSFPVYRHPADESPPLTPFSPTVAMIRDYVQKVIDHPVNHVLIQFYRSGKDYISEHSDKTIDVVRGSNIVNVSLGAQRVMTLKTKKEKYQNQNQQIGNGSEGSAADAPATMPVDTQMTPDHVSTPVPSNRSTQKIPLLHNSMFVMGLETNSKWLHAINHDNRPVKTKSPEERAFEGARISLTFRHIGTFLSANEKEIWGQGAKAKTKEEANQVIHDEKEVERLIAAFGEENQKSDFDWERAYGEGSDVLHFTLRDLANEASVGPPS